MIRLLIAFAIAASAFLSLYALVKIIRNGEEATPKVRAAISVLLLSSLVMTSEVCCERQALYKSLLVMHLMTLIFLVMLSPLWKLRRSLLIVNLLSVLLALAALEEVLYVSGLSRLSWEKLYVLCCVSLALLCAGLFLYGVRRRMMDIRGLLKDASVWINLEYSIESAYVVAFLLISLISAVLVSSEAHMLLLASAVLMTMIETALLALRLIRGNLLVLNRKHETKILESLRISQVEMANGVKPDSYRELYERILEYFETRQPFLNSNLTINDVVRVLYSNKSYISKVISIFTGRNFRQFVNYYRVAYAVGSFRANPNLNVSQLATMSGFNSAVSFNMAFRYFMAENPSEWCRKERTKILMKKK